MSICQEGKVFTVVIARGIDSKGKAVKIPLMAAFLSSEQKILKSRARKMISNKIFLVFEKYEERFVFIFLRSKRNTINSNIEKMLLQAIGNGIEAVKRTIIGKRMQSIYFDLKACTTFNFGSSKMGYNYSAGKIKIYLLQIKTREFGT